MSTRQIFLVDTGPLVAWLDKSDPAHALVAAAWSSLRGLFLTTAAVLTEAHHLLKDIPGAPDQIAAGVTRGLIIVEDTFHGADLSAAALLIRRYADTPMDFADATLVVLAERLGTPRILTLDERGFRTYRYARRKPFQLVIQDGAAPGAL